MNEYKKVIISECQRCLKLQKENEELKNIINARIRLGKKQAECLDKKEFNKPNGDKD